MGRRRGGLFFMRDCADEAARSTANLRLGRWRGRRLEGPKTSAPERDDHGRLDRRQRRVLPVARPYRRISRRKLRAPLRPRCSAQVITRGERARRLFRRLTSSRIRGVMPAPARRTPAMTLRPDSQDCVTPKERTSQTWRDHVCLIESRRLPPPLSRATSGRFVS